MHRTWSAQRAVCPQDSANKKTASLHKLNPCFSVPTWYIAWHAQERGYVHKLMHITWRATY